MKKVWMILSVAVILAVSVVFLCLYQFKIDSRAVRLMNEEIKSNTVSFGIALVDSGYMVKDYKYIVKDDILYIEFYGTMFSAFGIKSSRIVLNEKNIKDIVVVDCLKGRRD